jgi:two-component system sensor histidine kinase HydH
VLSVSDTGPGISPEHLPSIFDPGFSTRAGSPGLGLAVCRKIVQQHGGSIMAESRPGCGATFTLVFPLTDKPLADQPLADKTVEGVAE